jgi:hypothetical protein
MLIPAVLSSSASASLPGGGCQSYTQATATSIKVTTTPTSVTISWTDNPTSNVVDSFQWGVSTSYGYPSETPTDHSVYFDYLAPNQTYDFEIAIAYTGTGCYTDGSAKGSFSTPGDYSSTISGWVEDADGNPAPAGMYVQLFCAAAGSSEAFATETTGSNGFFEFDDVDALRTGPSGYGSPCVTSSPSTTGFTVSVCNTMCPIDIPGQSGAGRAWSDHWNETISMYGEQNDILFSLPMVTDQTYTAFTVYVQPTTDSDLSAGLYVASNPSTFHLEYQASTSAPSDICLTCEGNLGIWSSTVAIPGGSTFFGNPGGSFSVAYSFPTTGLVYFDARGARTAEVGWALPFGNAVGSPTMTDSVPTGATAEPGSDTCSGGGPVACWGVDAHSTQAEQQSVDIDYTIDFSESAAEDGFSAAVDVGFFICDIVLEGACTATEIAFDVVDLLLHIALSGSVTVSSATIDLDWDMQASSSISYFMSDYITDSPYSATGLAAYIWQCSTFSASGECVSAPPVETVVGPVSSNCFGGGTCTGTSSYATNGEGTTCVISSFFELPGYFMLIAINYLGSTNIISSVTADGSNGAYSASYIGGEFGSDSSVAFYEIASEAGGSATITVTLSSSAYGDCKVGQLPGGTSVGTVGAGGNANSETDTSLSVTNAALHEPSLLLALFGSTRPSGPWEPAVPLNSWIVGGDQLTGYNPGTNTELIGYNDTAAGTVTFTQTLGNSGYNIFLSGIVVEFYL